MIIVTDLLILINYLIYVSVTLPYLPQIFGHLSSLPYLFLDLNKNNLLPNVVSKIAGGVANSVDPDETPHFVGSHLDLHSLLRPVCLNTYGYWEV